MWIPPPPPRPPPQYEPQHDVIRTKMRYRDHIMAASGYGGGECYCGQNGISDVAALAAGAIGAFLLYQVITMAMARRKKRNDGSRVSPFEVAKDLMLAGKEATLLVHGTLMLSKHKQSTIGNDTSETTKHRTTNPAIPGLILDYFSGIESL